MTAWYWVLRRELHVMLRAPIVYVVGGVFLVVQGVAFAGLVGTLADPRKPAPLGALLEQQLAGTLLTWVLSLVVLTLLGMRAIADDKKTGAWELLLTAQVSERAAVIGKWLAASVIYALLWLPTLAYLGVVSVFRVDAGGWDLATVATGYAGAIAIGAALLAWTIAASAAMASTLGAGALGFALLIGLFLVGELPDLAPTLATDHPSLASVFGALSVRGAALAFARGELSAAALVYVLALLVVGLSLAIALACAGRRRRREVRMRVGATALFAVIGGALLALCVRHPAVLDVSADRRNSLDPATLGVLSRIDAATLTIVRPTLGGLEPIYAEVARVGARIAEQRGFTVRVVDPANAPGGLPAIARAAGVAPTDLATGGAVIVDVGARRRVIDLLSLATIQATPQGAPVVEQLAIEQAITGALAALVQSSPLTVCATTGHGELPIDSSPDAADWSVATERLRGEAITVETTALPPAAHCTVLAVIGPTTPLSPAEALAVQTFVQQGGALLVAAASRALPGGGLGRTGLEGVLAAHALGIPEAIVVDPSLTVRELPGALLVVDGYSVHAINRGFAGARATLWFQPRPVEAGAGATPLVRATAASWGERDLRAPPEKDGDDLAGPAVLAAIGSGDRVIAIGSAESLSSAVLAGGASAGDLWLVRVVRFLARAPEPVVDVAARRPDQVRLVMTDGQRTAVIALSVAGIPLAWLLVGGALVLWRRRRT